MILQILKRAGVSLENPNTPLGKFTLIEALGGGARAASGAMVNDRTAVTISAVYSAVSTIASTVGSLPLRVYQLRADGRGKDRVLDHPLEYLFNVESSPGVSAATFREAAMAHLLLRGNMAAFHDGFVSRRGQITSLELIDPKAYEIRVEDGRPVVFLTEAARTVPPEMVLRCAGMGGDGYRGWSIIHLAREAMGAALAQEEYGARFFANDATPRGVLMHDEHLSPEAKSNLRAHWNQLYGGAGNSHRIAVLEEGMKFQPISLTAEDTQFLQSRQFTIREIARWFNIQPHKIADLQDAKWANIESQNLEYVTDTLMPWLTRWEQSIRGQLMTERERRTQRLTVEFDVNALLRGDAEARANYLQTRFQTGSITPDEIRMMEGDNPLEEGGGETYLQLQMVPASMLPQVHSQRGAPLVREAKPEARRLAPPPELRTAKQTRAFEARQTLRDLFRDELTGRFYQVVRGEIREVKKLIGLLDPARRREFDERVADYYFGDFRDFARDIMEPPFFRYGKRVAEEAEDEAPDEAPGEWNADELEEFVRGYTRAAMDKYAAGHRNKVFKTVRKAEEAGEDPGEALTAELDSWVDEEAETARPPEVMARQHTVELNEAVATLVFGALGITALVSRTRGDSSCPYCRALDGVAVAPGEYFLVSGQEFQPDGAESPLTVRTTKGHPPYHGGCDCTVVPSLF